MKIGMLNRRSTTSIILWLLRLSAPRQANSFWHEVYRPWIQDGDGSLLEQRVGTWCKRWKMASDRCVCASKLLFYAFDSYWRDYMMNQTVSREEARFIAAINDIQRQHFRWAIWAVVLGESHTRIAASPGELFDRRGPKPGDKLWGKVTPKAVRTAVRKLLERAGLPALDPGLPGRPRRGADVKGPGNEQIFVSQRELELGECPEFLGSMYVSQDISGVPIIYDNICI